MKDNHWIIGPNCSVRHDQYGTHIGTDMRMNGMDSPATIHTTQEAEQLIFTLQRLYLDKDEGRK